MSECLLFCSPVIPEKILTDGTFLYTFSENHCLLVWWYFLDDFLACFPDKMTVGRDGSVRFFEDLKILFLLQYQNHAILKKSMNQWNQWIKEQISKSLYFRYCSSRNCWKRRNPYSQSVSVSKIQQVYYFTVTNPIRQCVHH